VTVKGGLGDDVVWANRGDNWLFGDAGNDRLVGANGDDVIVGGCGDDSLHGGGGDDVFAYGDYAWGQDTIEQLPGGDLLLWFEDGMKLGGVEGDIQLTSDVDGNAVLKRVGSSDKVTVKGYTQAEVADRLVFGSGTYNGQNYGELTAMGVFSPASTERVFEERTRGQLA
jgi:Ca2+-binding RTX toxin-like protein